MSSLLRFYQNSNRAAGSKHRSRSGSSVCSFSFEISPRGFLVCLSLQIASFYSAAVASRIRRATVLQHIESQSIQIRNFCFKSFFMIFSTKSSAICCIVFSIEISPLVSVFPNSYFNTLELISIFFSLKTPQLFYTITFPEPRVQRVVLLIQKQRTEVL